MVVNNHKDRELLNSGQNIIKKCKNGNKKINNGKRGNKLKVVQADNLYLCLYLRSVSMFKCSFLLLIIELGSVVKTVVVEDKLKRI
jgi:hypothetical protein